MIRLGVHMDAEKDGIGFTTPGDEPPPRGLLADIGLLSHGTEDGHATVAMRVVMIDGTEVFVETTWRLLNSAIRTLRHSEIAKREVDY